MLANVRDTWNYERYPSPIKARSCRNQGRVEMPNYICKSWTRWIAAMKRRQSCLEMKTECAWDCFLNVESDRFHSSWILIALVVFVDCHTLNSTHLDDEEGICTDIVKWACCLLECVHSRYTCICWLLVNEDFLTLILASQNSSFDCLLEVWWVANVKEHMPD